MAARIRFARSTATLAHLAGFRLVDREIPTIEVWLVQGGDHLTWYAQRVAKERDRLSLRDK